MALDTDATNIKYFFGIDFGTTNSATCGCMINDAQRQSVKFGDDEGRPIPSAIAIDKNSGQVYTGREAWDKKMQLSESCEYVPSVKSLLEDENWSREINGRIWTPVDVASEVFKGLQGRVKAYLGGNVELATATVAIPIGFSANKRRKLREAAQKAGITISAFISEPTAAFFANYNALKAMENIAIFDWGGGTLDVSILKNINGKISELATAGINIAGNDIDEKVTLRMHEKIVRSHSKKSNTEASFAVSFADLSSSAQDLLRVRVERAKRELSTDDEARISMLSYGSFGQCKVNLDYGWFADIIQPEIEQAMSCLRQAIDQSGIGLANIGKIVMVGGSSNLGPLQDEMKKVYGDKVYLPENSEWNVAEGAAMLANDPGGYYSNQSVGIQLSDGTYFEILGKDKLLTNWSKKFRFGIVDTSSEARFVFSGSPDIDESQERYKSLAIPTYQFLQEEIDLVARVDENLVFQVLAKSSMHNKSYSRLWEYTKLKCYYK